MYRPVSRDRIAETVTHLRELYREFKPSTEQEHRAHEKREVVAKNLLSNLFRTKEHPTLRSVLEVADVFSLTLDGAHRLFGYDLESIREYDLLLNGGRTRIPVFGAGRARWGSPDANGELLSPSRFFECRIHKCKLFEDRSKILRDCATHESNRSEACSFFNSQLNVSLIVGIHKIREELAAVRAPAEISATCRQTPQPPSSLEILQQTAEKSPTSATAHNGLKSLASFVSRVHLYPYVLEHLLFVVQSCCTNLERNDQGLTYEDSGCYKQKRVEGLEIDIGNQTPVLRNDLDEPN